MQIQLIILAIALISLAYGSYTDVRKRTINSFLFIPLIAISTAFYIYAGVSALFIAVGLLTYLLTYLKPDIILYPVAGIALLLASFFVILNSGILVGFNLTIMAVMFLTGFQERFFGIGDIKALVALSYSFIGLPFFTPVTQQQSILFTVMPPSLAILINVAILSILFIPYVIILAGKNGGRKDLPPLLMHYDEDYYNNNRAKFAIREIGGEKYLSYRTPFLLPITGGFLITIVFGIWFFLF